MSSTIAALGRPITVQAGVKVDIVLPDKTIDIARLADPVGAPLDGGLLPPP